MDLPKIKREINSLISSQNCKLLLGIIIIAFAIITQSGCTNEDSNTDPIASKTDYCLNTVCEISIYAGEANSQLDEDEANEILTGAFKEIRNYENILSKTIAGSDVDNINNAKGESITVSEDTYSLIELGNEMSELSNGKFDITVGRLTDLWDFESEDPEVPKKGDIKDALATVGYEYVTLEGEGQVAISNEDTKIDLGAIAKGYIADRTCEYLENNGITSAVINLGGNIVAIGNKTDGSEWNIGIERPYSDRTEIIGSVQVSDMTVVTSGVYERMFEKDGKLYHHIIDPATGYPADTDVEAITIIAEKGNSALCDGLSTTCLMIGKDKAIELIESLKKERPELNINAVIIDTDDETYQTEGLEIDLR